MSCAGPGSGTTLVELGPVRTGMWDGIVAPGLASAALDAVEAGRRHVVLPRRLTPVMALGWLPRRVSELALLGVPRR